MFFIFYSIEIRANSVESDATPSPPATTPASNGVGGASSNGNGQSLSSSASSSSSSSDNYTSKSMSKCFFFVVAFFRKDLDKFLNNFLSFLRIQYQR